MLKRLIAGCSLLLAVTYLVAPILRADEPKTPAKAEPAKAAEPAKTEPAKTEPGKADPAKPAEPAPSEPKKPEGDKKPDGDKKPETAKSDGEKKTEPAKTEPGKTEPAKPEGEKKPEPTKPAEAGSPGPQAKAFAAKLAAWKDIIKQLRGLQRKFTVAEEPEAKEIREKFAKLLEEGNKLLPEVRKAAIAAFAEYPNGDRELTKFLVKLASDDLARDDYEAAGALTKTLIENKCFEPELPTLAAAVDFALHDFSGAAKLWQQVKDAGVAENLDERKIQAINEYVKLWEDEQAIRAKEVKADDLPRVKLETTKGAIVIELFENEAPNTVANFVHLVEKGYYNGLTFHRVLPGFMAQGGCPKGDGSGGPGWKIADELDPAKYRRHFRGSLSMANSGPDTNGSQFFLTFLPTPELNGKHTVFGRVVEGMDVLAKIQRRDPDARDKPRPEPDKIVKAEVVRKRAHEYAPTKLKAE